MRYAAACIRQEQERTAYRLYVTDALKLLSENTAKAGGGSYINARWWEMTHPVPADTRTAEQIAADIIRRAGLEVRNRGST